MSEVPLYDLVGPELLHHFTVAAESSSTFRLPYGPTVGAYGPVLATEGVSYIRAVGTAPT